MKQFKFLCLASIFVVLFAVSGSAQGSSTAPLPAKPDDSKKEQTSPVVAKWEITISAPGQEMPGTLSLEKDGEGFKGSVLTDLGEAPLKQIKIKDDSFTADITVNAQGQTMEGTITGSLKEDKLTGEINLPGIGAISYAGKKPANK